MHMHTPTSRVWMRGGPAAIAVMLLTAFAADATAGSGNYLIVTPPGFADSAPLTQFANFKAAQGFNVMTYTVPSGTSRQVIKNYILSLWGTENAPQYILLVGDTDGANSGTYTIPHWIGGGTRQADTDWPYGCMDAGDDWHPEIPVGRFSARTVATLQAIVDKSIFVESGQFPDPDYVKRGAFLANPDTGGLAEPTHDWVIANYFVPNGYTGIRIYAAQGGDTNDVTNAVNLGCLWVVYMGHSGSSGWWDPAFDQSNVNALSNAGLYGLVFGFSCNTSHYSYDECFGETWQRAANKGAAAYISASNYIYWGSYEAWLPSAILELSFYESFFERDLWEIGPAWLAALYDFEQEYLGSTEIERNFFEEFVILGDPSLHLPEGVGFELEADPLARNLCSPPEDQAVYTINVVQHMGYDQPVTLSASGVPPGATVEFSANSLPPPFTSVMTVGNLIGFAPAQYEIEVKGQSPDYGRSVFVGLNLSNAPPGAVTLVSPANGATDVARRPTLEWTEATQGVQYEIELATDPLFADIAYSAIADDTIHVVADSLDTLTTYYWHVRALNGCGQGSFSTTYHFTTIEQPDYFTEDFRSGFDLDYFTLAFIPDGSGDFYRVCGGPITTLPTNPATGTEIFPGEDGWVTVSLAGGAAVWLYGQSYTSFYVNSNGNITFNGGDGTWEESLASHFNQPRISALYDDFSPQNGDGRVSWQQFSDRAVVTFETVPEYSNTGANTFQFEMFFNGEIHLSWLSCSANDGIVGLSAGGGQPADFIESDLSQSPGCGPLPPEASNGNATTPANTPVTIPLIASDDGLPDPPGALSFIIVSLPPNGTLSDPGAGSISSVPYTLAGFGNEVVYTPHPWYVGLDSFTFRANDGGTPPDGGDSNVATVWVTVTPPAPELVYSFPLDSDPGWTTQGAWAFGQPTGAGSHNRDPLAGHTGSFVYGYNLAGDYTNNMPARYLTAGPLDCADLVGTELRCWRWLGVEGNQFDHATIEVSTDGNTWTPVWSNPTQAVADLAWTQLVLDISTVADGAPAVYIRWGMGPTDGGVTYPGWNIDDVEIWAVVVATPCPGDLDGDGDVDLADLSVLLAAYGLNAGGDLDGDNDTDLSDLALLLSNYGCAP